ncbi:MAG TPA: lamin tail domain-containing protein, partial [Saprospiraceae bacterium]|nr:lamin tail domain-containing protein [Saprospiraceae bacterium]
TAQLAAGKTSVVLSLASPLATGAYTVQASGLKDLAGNVSATQSFDFQYIYVEAAAEFDIVINEIMPDVNPVFGLPEVEWVELYNRSAKIIDLSTLRFADGAAAGLPLPACLLYPGRFAVLTAAAKVATLRPFSADTVLAAVFSLNDSGDLLTLSTPSGAVISKVDYRADWHTDPAKDEGGWSLERINPHIPCLGKTNWASCPLLPGGTPGKSNASLDLSPDTQAPRLLETFPESPTEIRLHFSEGLDVAAAADLSAYRISPARVLAAASLYPDERGTVRLTLAEPLQLRTVYTLLVSAPIADCSGNELAGVDTVLIGLPERPAPGDVLVNELLFNPASGGARFVECYNRSDKVIDWSACFVADFSASPNPIAIAARRLGLPGAYTVFTPDPADILTRFAGAKPADVVEQSLPSWDEKAGNVTLQWSKGGQMVVLDSFRYSDEYHNALFSIGDREGVALERIRQGGPTNDPANWTSAAVSRTLGPGSPTWPNSQRLDDLPLGGIGDLLQLSPARFSPDGDGFEDFLDIR